MEAYRSPQQPARYRMNTNESPYPPPRALVEEVLAELKQTSFQRYPDQDAAELAAGVAAHNDWPVEGVWVANGSNEVFLHLYLAFGGLGRTSLTFEPTYSLHSLIPRMTGTTTVTARRAADHSLSPEACVSALAEHRPHIVVLCSPNNPTGRLEPLAVVEAALENAPGLVVVDEAYIEFADDNTSVRRLLDDHPNLAVTKTFSKAWSLAGARLGYMLAHPWLIERIAKVRLPYHLSTPSQLLGLAALRHPEEALASIRSITTERDRIILRLDAMGLDPMPSQANFVLFRVEDPRAVWTGLLERGVLIRDYSTGALLPQCLRVTATKPQETDAFLSALEEVLG
jgi:histidinol-phosphate aminotransferase